MTEESTQQPKATPADVVRKVDQLGERVDALSESNHSLIGRFDEHERVVFDALERCGCVERDGDAYIVEPEDLEVNLPSVRVGKRRCDCDRQERRRRERVDNDDGPFIEYRTRTSVKVAGGVGGVSLVTLAIMLLLILTGNWSPTGTTAPVNGSHSAELLEDWRDNADAGAASPWWSLTTDEQAAADAAIRADGGK